MNRAASHIKCKRQHPAQERSPHRRSYGTYGMSGGGCAGGGGAEDAGGAAAGGGIGHLRKSTRPSGTFLRSGRSQWEFFATSFATRAEKKLTNKRRYAVEAPGTAPVLESEKPESGRHLGSQLSDFMATGSPPRTPQSLLSPSVAAQSRQQNGNRNGPPGAGIPYPASNRKRPQSGAGDTLPGVEPNGHHLAPGNTPSAGGRRPGRKNGQVATGAERDDGSATRPTSPAP
jgi:hypothetical protein